MGRLFGGGQFGQELPRPQRVVALLLILTAMLWAITLIGMVAMAVTNWDAMSSLTPAMGWVVASAGVIQLLLWGALIVAVALMLKYAFSAAVSVKLMERMLRENLQKPSAAPAVSEGGTAAHEELVSVLSEIMENTLLDDHEKAAKRQLTKKHRQQTLRREIEALIKAAKFKEARERLEEFRVRYADSADQAQEMESHLSDALRRHEQAEASRVSEQVQRYIGLGLWDRAMEMAQALAEQFPENPEASRLPETIRLEQEATRRQEQQRIYREIEHLVGRKHWREAARAAETLLEKHPESPEANALRDQMDELRRNAAIAERKEWEARIAEHIQTGRHREAYDLAVELMKKYPDSPQADQIRKRLDQLKVRAGIVE